MSRTRRRFTADRKAESVRWHLSGKEVILNLAAEFGVQLSQIDKPVKQEHDQAEICLKNDWQGGREMKDDVMHNWL